MNQVMLSIHPMLVIWLKQLSQPLSPMQIRKSTEYLFFNPDMRKLTFSYHITKLSS